MRLYRHWLTEKIRKTVQEHPCRWQGRVVSSFGWQKAEEKFNKGIVLETDEVSAVKAAYDGTVEEIYKDGGYYTIVLTHEGGLKSVYGGCASIVVKGNMRVQRAILSATAVFIK